MELCYSRCSDWYMRNCTGYYIGEEHEKEPGESMRNLQEGIKVGARILFAGGIFGKIVRIKNDVIDVEISKNTVIQISRYSIQDVITD